MYRIMIVDDETLMRNYLAKKITEFTDKFDAPVVACDGMEAMAYINQQHFDVVITDIKMPEIDGLQLAKYIQNNAPDTVVIIISGFSDFEYARKAIQYNVKDYLLKPLVDDSLRDLLNSVLERFEKQKTPVIQNVITEKTEASLSQKLLYAILNGEENNIYYLYQTTQMSNVKIMDAVGCIVKFIPTGIGILPGTINGPQSQHYELNLCLNTICSNQNNGPLLFSQFGETFLLMSAETIDALNASLDAIYNAVKRSFLPDRPHTSFCMFVGSYVHDIMELQYSAKSISMLLDVTMLGPYEKLYYWELSRYEKSLASLRRFMNEFYIDLLAKANDKIKLDLHILIDQYLTPCNGDIFWRVGSYIIQFITDKSNSRPNDVLPIYRKLQASSLNMPSKMSSEFLNHTLSTLLTDLFGISSKDLSTPIIKEAENYILAHYMENISLSDVADYCNVSSSYLSDLFHKQLHIPYSKYLLSLRMEQAAKLIRMHPKMKIYEIAQATGYISTKHFISVFKKTFGITPAEYRKIHCSE